MDDISAIALSLAGSGCLLAGSGEIPGLLAMSPSSSFQNSRFSVLRVTSAS